MRKNGIIKRNIQNRQGPSTVILMGPQRAAVIFAGRHPEAVRFEVTSYGSLAATGKGHMTDKAIIDVRKRWHQWRLCGEPEVFLPYHPNGMLFRSFGSEAKPTDEWTVYSVSGGALQKEKQREINFTTTSVRPSHVERHHKGMVRTSRTWLLGSMCETVVKMTTSGIIFVEVGTPCRLLLNGDWTVKELCLVLLNLARKAAATYYVKARGYKPSFAKSWNGFIPMLWQWVRRMHRAERLLLQRTCGAWRCTCSTLSSCKGTWFLWNKGSSRTWNGWLVR